MNGRGRCRRCAGRNFEKNHSTTAEICCMLIHMNFRKGANRMQGTNRTCLVRGMRDGVPISLGYFAVAFTLGIAARRAGLTAFQAALASCLTMASAGQYAGFTVIAENGAYFTMAVMILVANARYLLMSCALTQKLSPNTKLLHRLLMGLGVTDEIFGVSIAVPGRLNPFYFYGVLLVATPGWTAGTYLGVLMGSLLPGNLVSALSVGLYGMFLAVIVPPARKNRVIGCLVAISMALSLLADRLSLLSHISSGTKIILLTVVISAAAAVLFPVKDGPEAEGAPEGGVSDRGDQDNSAPEGGAEAEERTSDGP